MAITKSLLRSLAPLFSETRDRGTPNALASWRLTSLFALPSAGGALVLTRNCPFCTPWIPLELLLVCTRTGTIRSCCGTASGVTGRARLQLQTGTGLYVCSTISAAFNMTIAKIGEMSIPPMRGTTRRNGRSTGSDMVVSSAVIGL